MKEGLFQTLWDLVERVITPPAPPSAPMPSPGPATTTLRPAPKTATMPAHPAPATASQSKRRSPRQIRIVPTVAIPALSASPTAQEQYDRVMRLMLARYNIKVRKWRKSSSGVAYELQYRDGTIKRLIESPYPKGPMSMAIFLHEIGHHAIGFNVYKPRCLEEYHAWAFALAAMQEHNLNITDAVRRRMHRSLHYAISKAARRGLKTLPAELVPYLQDAPKKAA
jgi:hypothetical protein